VSAVQRGPAPPIDKIAIERIAARTREKFKRDLDHYLELIRRCDAVMEVAAELPLLDQARLRQQRYDLQVRADAITRHLRKWKFWQYMALLELAERAGVDLGYTSSSKGGPSGPGIDYLVAAAAQIGLPISASPARRLIKAYNKLFITAVFEGKGELSADVSVVPPALWFWDIDR